MLPHLCIKITNLGLKNSRNDLALSDVSSLDSANAPSHGISHCSTTATMVRVGHFNLYHLMTLYIDDLYPDLGKVLAGIQVPSEDFAAFGDFLDRLGYLYVEETDNEIYKRYLT